MRGKEGGRRRSILRPATYSVYLLRYLTFPSVRPSVRPSARLFPYTIDTLPLPPARRRANIHSGTISSLNRMSPVVPGTEARALSPPLHAPTARERCHTSIYLPSKNFSRGWRRRRLPEAFALVSGRLLLLQVVSTEGQTGGQARWKASSPSFGKGSAVPPLGVASRLQPPPPTVGNQTPLLRSTLHGL